MTITFHSESITIWVCADFDNLPFTVLRAIYQSDVLNDASTWGIWN